MSSTLRAGQVRSNAMPKTGVCEQKLLASTVSLGLPTGARQLGLSRKLPVRKGVHETCPGTHGGLSRRHVFDNAWGTSMPSFSEFWSVSRNRKWGHFQSRSRKTADKFYSPATSSRSEGFLRTLPKCQVNAKSQSQLTYDLGSGPDLTPSEHTSNDWELDNAWTRGNLFESPRHLEELALPEETKRFVRVLESPHKGSLVYLIGTAHVSKASVDDVRLLIEAVKPTVVGVEVSLNLRVLAVDHGCLQAG
jgi:hypothetical protein